MDWANRTRLLVWSCFPFFLRLVRSDPVTCARFFDHRLQQFLNYVLNSKLHPIGRIKDSFVRIEFQQHGSPHAHIMFWIHQAPKLNESSPEEVAFFVDEHVSWSSQGDEVASFVELQQHRHSKTCRKKHKAVCRFRFPKPPMVRTCFLEPLSSAQNEQANTNYEKVERFLSDYKDGIDMSYQEFLDALKLTEDEYIDAVQTSINREAAFLQRQAQEIRLNPYMKHLLSIYGTNHDIQFITDQFACAVYIMAYMSKSQRGMSVLMDKVCKEAKESSSDIRKQVHYMGKVAYLILQLPITQASCTVVFINTSPPKERSLLLKSKQKLQELDPESTDIESGNAVTRYAARPKFLEKWCLADYVSKLNIIYPDTYTDPYDTDHENDPDAADKDEDETESLHQHHLQQHLHHIHLFLLHNRLIHIWMKYAYFTIKLLHHLIRFIRL